MAHKVMLYDAAKGYDADGFKRPERIVETDDAAAAESLACAALAEQQSISAAHIKVDWRLCETIGDYLHLTNAIARWLEKNPIEGSFIGTLAEEPEHWAEYGVETPEGLEKYLILQDYSDYHKEVYGVRPRGHGLSMDTPIEELEAAMDQLTAARDADRPAADPEPEF